MKRTFLSLLTAIIIVSVFLTFSITSCKASGATDTTSAGSTTAASEDTTATTAAAETTVSGEKVELNVWAWAQASWVINQIEESYEAEHPNVDIVKTEMGAWDLMDKLLVSLSTGQGLPDAVEVVNRVYDPYMESGKMMDLTEKVSEYKDDLLAGQLAEVTLDDKIYALPTENSWSVMMINKDVFEEAGIDYTKLVTWDDYIEAGKTLREKDKYLMDIIYPATGGNGSMAWNMYFMSKEGNIFTEDGKLIRDNKVAKEMFKWFYEVLAPVCFVGPHPMSDPTVFTKLGEGEIAAYGMDSTQLVTVQNKVPQLEGKLTIVPWPVWSKSAPKILGRWGGASWAIPQDSKHPNEAWDLIEYLGTSDEGIEAMWESGSLLTSYKPGWSLPGINKPMEFYDNKVFTDIIKDYDTGYAFHYFDWLKVQESLGIYLDKMFDGSMTPEEAWDACEADIAAKTGR